MLTVTKSYRDFPAAHRQPNHAGHCRLIHGHNFGFDITFACARLDPNGFVVDVGELKVFKDVLTDMFDHTLLLNEGDVFLDTCQDFSGFAKEVIVPNCGMEGLAEYLLKRFNEMIVSKPTGHLPHSNWHDWTDRELRVVEVVVWEDSKNSASYSTERRNVVKHPLKD